ncbi:uncharacterized protein LOC121591480 isoform X3 [Anopheles merus]|uniref:uncharacterized protein LOC121591480 isoform X3 n=1 Tax=Anopheles merus TaxID=30066 RepID=UPI001BE47A3A|nr:uncharacterized protein LOC121591480 isoform X3 [Anopheles merus]
MTVDSYRRSPWHKSWHFRSTMYCAASWTFWTKLLLIHVCYISIGAVRNGDWAAKNINEWRPPEPNPWSPFAGTADSPVTLLTSSLDHAAQSSGSSAHFVYHEGHGRSSVNIAETLRTRVDSPSSVTSLYRLGQTPHILPSDSHIPLETVEKHFLFRRDLSKTQSTSLRHTLAPAQAWADNGAGPICQDPGSMDGNCTTNRERPPTLMTNASNVNPTEDLLVPFASNHSYTANDSAFWILKDLALATLQSPLEDNHTTHSYPAVDLNDHNDVLCDDDSDQMEYNENCFIDHNVTCVGDPDFCNLTYSEYRQLLMDYIYPSTGEWILIASHTVVFLMGLVGNALVCIAVYTNHTMRTVTNIFIVNLAVADFFVILFCLPPTVVWDVTETWFMGKAMCKVVIYFQAPATIHDRSLFPNRSRTVALGHYTRPSGIPQSAVWQYTVDIGQSDIVAVLSLFSHWLCYANSAVNPVIYNFMSGKFRREFKNALEKCRCLRSSHAYGGRVGGYDDRSLCHTATRLNVSPSTRSNYHLASVRDARFKQHTQQTSFNGSRHQHGRNSINHPGSLQPQISPISVEERLALTKSLDGETLQLTNRKNSSTLTGSSNGSGLGNGNGNGAGNGSPSMLHQHQHGNLHSHHSEQHKDQTLAEDATTTVQEQSVTAPTTMLMIVNKSSNCKIGGT